MQDCLAVLARYCQRWEHQQAAGLLYLPAIQNILGGWYSMQRMLSWQLQTSTNAAALADCLTSLELATQTVTVGSWTAMSTKDSPAMDKALMSRHILCYDWKQP